MTATNTEAHHDSENASLQRGHFSWARFVVITGGVGAWTAYQLGAFIEPADARDYIIQVETAAARQQWTTPPALNVVELTRAATDLWPDDPNVRQLGQRMAARLLAEVATRGGTQPERATEFIRAAREFDPNAPLLDLLHVADEGSPASGYEAPDTSNSTPATEGALD